jgi:Domain of unknown function (DUF1707)/Domain of unknown function (DUF4190)
MAVEAPMAAEEDIPPAGDGWAKIRAADADREHMAGLLGTAYTEGRLTKDEYDARLDAALSARTYADLNQLVTDLPVRAPVPVDTGSATVAPVAKANGLAVASLLFGFAQFLVGPVATVPAIVLGHMARNQIKQTGEQGAGLALAGLVLGWGAVALGIILMFAVMIVAAGTHGAVQTP